MFHFKQNRRTGRSKSTGHLLGSYSILNDWENVTGVKIKTPDMQKEEFLYIKFVPIPASLPESGFTKRNWNLWLLNFSNCLRFRASYLFARNSSICSRQVVQWLENELRATQQQSSSIRGAAKRCHHWSPLCMVGSWPSYLLHLLWLFAIAGFYQVLTNANGSTNKRLLIFSCWTLTLRILSSDCQRLRRASMGSDVGVTSSRANVCKSFCRATGFQVFFYDFVDVEIGADACTDVKLNLGVPANVVGGSIHWHLAWLLPSNISTFSFYLS